MILLNTSQGKSQARETSFVNRDLIRDRCLQHACAPAFELVDSKYAKNRWRRAVWYPANDATTNPNREKVLNRSQR